MVERRKARRILLVALSTSALVPCVAFGQGRMWRVGFLSASTPSALASRVEAFRAGLKELGYVEGRNIAIEYRWAAGKVDQLPALAAELDRLKVAVLVTGGPSATRAAKQATKQPIVMSFDTDPVGSGFVASLARPGGNITGLSILAPEISGKQLDVLKQIVPKLSRVAVLGDSREPANKRTLQETERAASALGLTVHYQDIRAVKDFEEIFNVARRENADALVVLVSPMTNISRSELAAAAIRNRLPAIGWQPEFAAAGGLMTYSARLEDLARRAASYVDRILKGANPGDLPVELPDKFDLVINLKAAKQIGLKIPVEVLTRADRVIQ